MGKFSLPIVKKEFPMSDIAYLDQAAQWSKQLTRLKSRGPGDTENAMRQIAREYDIDYGFLWSLRYRRDRLKIMSKTIYDKIAGAYQAECERQLGKLKNEIVATEKVTGPDNHAVRAAKALVGEDI